MFLTEEEVAEFTEILRGCDGKTREQLQVEQLKLMGVPFWVGARGRPKVVREYFTGSRKTRADQEPKWEMPAHMR